MSRLFYLEESELNKPSAVLRIYGPDANTYLQGQFSQDMRLAADGGAYGLWLDQKGKIQGDSHVIRVSPADFLAVSFSMGAAELLQRLQAYLIADEVELADVTADWRAMLLWGVGSAELERPAGALGFPSRRAGTRGWEWLFPAARETEMLEAIRAKASPATRADAEWERLQSAMPAVPTDLGPRDLPQEGNLDRDAISYTKGCYLGQEVMARIKNLGQVRRALHLVTGMGPPPPPGTALHQAAQRVGEMRSGAARGGEYLAMAMLSLVTWQPDAPMALAAEGPGSVKVVRRV